RGRGARRAPWDHRLAAGERGAEAGARNRRAARRPPAALRRARAELHRGLAPPRPAPPRLRRAPDDHRVRRLRRVLRRRLQGPRMTAVRIPPTLRAETGGQREVEAEGSTVGQLLEDLTSRFPTLGNQLQYANV